MEQDHIAPEELSEITSSLSSIAPIEAEIAKLSIQKLSLEEEMGKQYDKWKVMSEHIESIKKKLADKYGAGNIDIRTGEIKRSK